MARLSQSIRDQLVAAADRIQRDYVTDFDRIGGRIGAYWNSTSLNIEVLFGRPIGTGWSAHSTFAVRKGWPFGKWIQTKQIDEAEAEIRQQIDHYLRERR